MSKSNIARFSKRPGRLIIVSGVKWRWQTPRGRFVVAYSEDGRKALDASWRINGSDPSCDDDVPITPSEVAEWLSQVPA